MQKSDGWANICPYLGELGLRGFDIENLNNPYLNMGSYSKYFVPLENSLANSHSLGPPYFNQTFNN